LSCTKFELARFSAVIETLSEFILASPESSYLPTAYFFRGTAKRKLGDKVGALQDYDRAIGLSPHRRDYCYDRGSLRVELGDITGGHEDIAAAVPELPGPIQK
jgi:hypothetical protein